MNKTSKQRKPRTMKVRTGISSDLWRLANATPVPVKDEWAAPKPTPAGVTIIVHGGAVNFYNT